MATTFEKMRDDFTAVGQHLLESEDSQFSLTELKKIMAELGYSITIYDYQNPPAEWGQHPPQSELQFIIWCNYGEAFGPGGSLQLGGGNSEEEALHSVWAYLTEFGRTSTGTLVE